MIKEEIIEAYALKNAIEHDGKSQVGSVISGLFQEGLQKKDLKKIIGKVKEIIGKVNKLNLNEQEIKFKNFEDKVKKREEHSGLHDLPNVKGKVVMRFAPYPSGALHIGNARTAILNDEYVKKYGGEQLLIIDDTIGSKEKEISKEAYKLIPEALEWLGIKYKKIFYKSDRLNLFYRYGKELIKKGAAYVCFCKQADLRNNRKEGKECSCRKKELKIDLEHWKDMLNGKYKEGEAIVRLKTDMKDPDPAFRDRVLFKISDRKHPRTNKKYRVWPTLEMSWSIDDHELGMTHILRGKELQIEGRVEKFIWKIFKWKPIELIYNGHLQLEGAKISKSKSRKEVLSGKYSGWDDPRTFSLQSLKRRGIQPEAIRKFIISFGINPTEVHAPLENLYKENKKIIEKSNRFFFIQDPVKIKIKNAPHALVKVPLHPDHVERGYRELKTTDEFYISKKDKIKIKKQAIRFMHHINFKNYEYLSKDYDPKLNALMLHWLPVSKDLVKVEITMPDGSIEKGLGEPKLKELKKDSIIQFERFGFVKLDSINKKEKTYQFWFTHH